MQGNGHDARVTGMGAMNLSLFVGALMLVGKSLAWWLTGSAAILSDALESVIHVVAVGFAFFSFVMVHRPRTEKFPYGFERMAFFSAGAEGALIIVAALGIIYTSVVKLIHGVELQQLTLGTTLIAAASMINGALGWHLIRTGRRTNSLILEANGKHVLTDCWTSLGVIAGLLLVMLTGWKPFDPLCAILVAINIMKSGGSLVMRSAAGLMDYADPALAGELKKRLDQLTVERGAAWHNLRFRTTGARTIAEVHLLFPSNCTIGDAHAAATEIEAALEFRSDTPLEVITHLEAREDHDRHHSH